MKVVLVLLLIMCYKGMDLTAKKDLGGVWETKQWILTTAKYEKPGVVKAVEDAFDFVGGRVNMFFKGDSNRDYEKELGDMPTM